MVDSELTENWECVVTEPVLESSLLLIDLRCHTLIVPYTFLAH
jgi:hypothetical protein